MPAHLQPRGCLVASRAFRSLTISLLLHLLLLLCLFDRLTSTSPMAPIVFCGATHTFYTCCLRPPCHHRNLRTRSIGTVGRRKEGEGTASSYPQLLAECPEPFNGAAARARTFASHLHLRPSILPTPTPPDIRSAAFRPEKRAADAFTLFLFCVLYGRFCLRALAVTGARRPRGFSR